ncbi:MAG TPA: transporter substrate-binding domain-containing protein, partial [Burkholderiaceae bacterium]|nr:transporter substrate-binding domain-containing protein [Burkholderiaceae bacterium]
FEDVPQRPWTMPDGTGLNFELLHRVEKLSGENFIFLSMPWKRCQEEVRNGELDGIVGAAESAERRLYAAFPTLDNGSLDTTATIYEDQFNVYQRVGSVSAWNGKELISPNRPVAVQSGYAVVAAMLRDQDIKINDSIKSAEDGLRFLLNGIVDVAVLQSIETEYLRKEDPRFKGTINTAATPYVILPLYLAINQTTYARDPKRIHAIWNAIRTVRNSAEYRKIVDSACREKVKFRCGT